jgi:hypothetical protein
MVSFKCFKKIGISISFILEKNFFEEHVCFESYLDFHLKLFVSPKELSNWILKIMITFLNGFLTFSKYRIILL